MSQAYASAIGYIFTDILRGNAQATSTEEKVEGMTSTPCRNNSKSKNPQKPEQETQTDSSTSVHQSDDLLHSQCNTFVMLQQDSLTDNAAA